MMFLESISLVEAALRRLAAVICSLIYKIVAALFELFINISRVELLSSGDIAKIYQRVTLIITIIMIFYVTFETVKYVIQPDTMGDKEKGTSKVVSKMIICVVLLAMVPKIFEFAFKLQNTIIDNQIIPKLILGPSATSTSNPKDMGRNFAVSTFALFYGYGDIPGEELLKDKNCKETLLTQEEYNKFGHLEGALWDMQRYALLGKSENYSDYGNGIAGANLCYFKNHGSFWHLTWELDEDDKEYNNPTKDAEEYIEFDGLMAIIVGGFMVYVLALYCIDLGTRVAQLAFLQIIAPIPIIGYLSPKKDNIFSKWVKQCTTTYLDLFLRMILIYFVLFLCNVIQDARAEGTLFNNIPSDSNKTLLYIAIILGLLMFAQKAPKMLQELFPKMGAASGNFGLKAGERVAPIAARAIGGGLGLARTGIGHAYRNHKWRKARNQANGWATGLERFTKEGREKNKQKREAAKQNRQQLKANRRRKGNLKNDTNVKNEFDSARNAWNEKVKGNQRIQNLTEEIKEANKRGDKATARNKAGELQQEYKKLESSNEFKRWNAARQNMNNSASVNEMRQNVKNNNQRKQEAEQKKREAEQEKREAGSDPIKQAAAQKKLDEANKTLDQVDKDISNQKDENNNFFKANYNEQMEELDNTIKMQEEKDIENRNKDYQGVVGSTFSTVTAAVGGMVTGAKATKLSEIHKQVSQAAKNDKASIQAVQKYYDEGGTGWVDRTVEQVKKSIGTPTDYEKTMLKIHSYDSQIKNYGAQADLAKSYSSAADSTENRFRDKAKDSKTEVNSSVQIKTGLTGDEEFAKINDGETLGSVVRRYKQNAITAQAELESTTKIRDDFKAQNATVLAKNESDMTDSEKEIMKRAKDYEKAVIDASQKKSNADYAAENVEKSAGRYDTIKVMEALATSTDPHKTFNELKTKFDGAGVENAWNLYQRMNIVRQNPDMVEAMKKELSPEYFEMFMTGKILDNDPNKAWKAYDTINNASKTVSSEYERLKTAKSEEQRNTQTSNETSAQKAANDYNSGGHK